MRYFYLKVAVVFLMSFNLNAEITQTGSINAKDGIPDWISSFSQDIEAKGASSQAILDCKETESVDNAFLCLSYTQELMNKSFLRASGFVEGLFNEPGKVSPHSDADLQYYLGFVAGHDLKVSDLMRFYDKVEEQCKKSSNDKDICLSDLEKEVYEELVLPMSKLDTEAVIITFAVQNSMNYKEVVSHEIMHAQYFLDEQYQKVADDFWKNNVSEVDKKISFLTLSRYYGVAGNELLLKNEFQAYILMDSAEDNMLRGLAQKYRKSFMKKMNDNGIEPIQVK